MPVTEALDRVLEILRTTELYSPQFGVKDEDPHANDLIGGLISVSALGLLHGARCMNRPQPRPPAASAQDLAWSR